MRVAKKGPTAEAVRVRRANRNGVRAKQRRKMPGNPFRLLRGVIRKRMDVDRYLETIRGR